MNSEQKKELIGVVDGSSLDQFSGWVYIRGCDEALEVELLVNGKLVASTKADIFRPGLLHGAQHPNGRCGFVIAVPSSEELVEGDHLHVRVRGQTEPLKRAQSRIVRSSAGSLILELIPDRLKVADSEEDHVDIPVFPKTVQRRSWAIFLNTVRALFLREVSQRYGASRFGYPWAIAQPLLTLLILTQAHALLGGKGESLFGVSTGYFFVLGIMPYFMFQHAYHQAMGAIASARGVFNYREVRPFDIVLVRCGIEFAIMLVVMVLSIAGFSWVGETVEFDDPLAMMASAGLLFVMAIGFGLIADIEITRNEDSRRIFALIERPLFFVSGVFFVVEIVPEPLRSWLMWNPLLHAIDLGRGAMLRGYESPCSWVYLCLWSFGLLLVGLAMYRRHLHRLLAA